MASLAPELLAMLRSPDTGRPLIPEGAAVTSEDGQERFPIVEGVPVLLGAESLFSPEDYLTVGAPPSTAQRAAASARRLLPSLSHNLVARDNYARLRELLQAAGSRRVLVVGGSIVGEGFETLLEAPGLEIVETDVAMGPRTSVICDAHFLPFADGTFDAVVCQAVLEHVADPPRVAAEIHRVLRADGLVYSEIPFMQQVHEGAHDFTRYTLTGHRRLFRDFDEIAAGVTAGPGMALGWAIRAFCAGAVGGGRAAQAAVNLVLTLSLFWLKLLDPLLLRTPAGADGAAGTYFLGRSRGAPVSDRQIVAAYSGANDGFSLAR